MLKVLLASITIAVKSRRAKLREKSEQNPQIHTKMIAFYIEKMAVLTFRTYSSIRALDLCFN